MAVYREGFHAVSEIQNQSHQVFSDACDFGVPVKPGHRIWNLAKQAVDMYGIEGTRKVHRYETGVTAESTIELMDEWDRLGEILKFKIVYVSAKIKGGFTGYIYVEPVNK